MRRLLRLLPLSFTLLCGIVQFTPLVPRLASALAEWPAQPPGGGTLIVLGAEQHADGTIGLMTYWRCVYAARLYKQGSFTHVLLSGGRSQEPPDRPSDPPPAPLAAEMARFLELLGVPRDRMLLETASGSTRENALFSIRVLNQVAGPYTIVTSDFHCYRARRCFRRAGLEAGVWPAPDVLKRFQGWQYRIPAAAVVASELAKIGYYFCRDWM